MNEHISKQLEEQVNKLIDDLVKEDFNQISMRCEAVNRFILKGDGVFEAGVKADKEKLDSDILKARKKCMENIETVLDQVKGADNQYDAVLNAVNTFHVEEQQKTIEYLFECINSISSYKHNVIDKDDKPSGEQSVEPTDDIDKFLKDK